jgi:phage major head subunit gpT-like protein
MPALTPSFLFDFESNLQVITEDEYAKFASNLWWDKFMKKRPSQSRRELVAWLLSTAMIQDLESNGGKMIFEDIVSKYAEFENRHAGAGLKLSKSDLEDQDGSGLEQAAAWSRSIGAYMAYWPQKQLVAAIKNGATSGYTGYDGVTFFNNAHPLNPYSKAGYTYANIFTGAAASTPSTDPNHPAYPGACPIDDSIDLDDALVNLGKAIAYIRSIRMPNGEDPRFLRPVGLLVPPRMQQRAVQLTNAKFIAQVAGSGAGSADVEAAVKALGLMQPIVADELAGFESNTTYFLACEEVTGSEMGGFVYVERDPFKITYYTGAGANADVQLDRMDELEWHCKGRNVVGYGHPYAFFKCKGS